MKQVARYLILCLLLGVIGCSKENTRFQASVEVTLLLNCGGPSEIKYGSIVATEELLAVEVDRLKLVERWSTPVHPISKEEAVRRLRSMIEIVPDVRGFTLQILSLDPQEGETIAASVSSALKSRAEKTAQAMIAKEIQKRREEADVIQRKLSDARQRLVALGKDAFVPSRFRMSPESASEMEAKIRSARADESSRLEQLDSLRKLNGEELRGALVTIEMGRVAAARASTTTVQDSSVLLTENQSQKLALKELELAKSGAIAETNAVGHAELRVEQANRNLTNTMSAYVKSLEIEGEIATARRKELEAQLSRMLNMNKLSEEKVPIEKEINSLNAQLISLMAETEQWQVCERLLPNTTQVGPVHVETVKAH